MPKRDQERFAISLLASFLNEQDIEVLSVEYPRDDPPDAIFRTSFGLWAVEHTRLSETAYRDGEPQRVSHAIAQARRLESLIRTAASPNWTGSWFLLVQGVLKGEHLKVALKMSIELISASLETEEEVDLLQEVRREDPTHRHPIATLSRYAGSADGFRLGVGMGLHPLEELRCGEPIASIGACIREGLQDILSSKIGKLKHLAESYEDICLLIDGAYSFADHERAIRALEEIGRESNLSMGEITQVYLFIRLERQLSRIYPSFLGPKQLAETELEAY
jgi:hypothetical protein